jgi:hypothetical protein
MATPRFRFASAPSVLRGTPAGWARELLREGEVAVFGDEGLEAIDSLAHELDLSTILLVRSEQTPVSHSTTVIDYAQSLPLIWVASEFDERAQDWARDRGPMTLLVESTGPLADEERRRIDRFVAILAPQSE